MWTELPVPPFLWQSQKCEMEARSWLQQQAQPAGMSSSEVGTPGRGWTEQGMLGVAGWPVRDITKSVFCDFVEDGVTNQGRAQSRSGEMMHLVLEEGVRWF